VWDFTDLRFEDPIFYDIGIKTSARPQIHTFSANIAYNALNPICTLKNGTKDHF
jgi:hypothetical protein